jgi:NTP pyrophosphatase (non-canonical NTP hydrolase)
MREFAEVYLELTRAIKKVHEFSIKNHAVEAYLTGCDVTDLAQELEDVLQNDANIQ